MDRKISDISRILEIENHLFLDNCCFTPTGAGHLLLKEIHKSKYYIDFNSEIFAQYSQFLYDFIPLFDHGNECEIAILPEVSREFLDARKIISKLIKNKPLYPRGASFKLIKESVESKSSIKFFLDLSKQFSDKLSEHLFETDDPRYTALCEMIYLLNEVFHLKKREDNRFGEHKIHESDTDERIVAALYYYSMFGDHNPAFITGDTDFIGLLSVSSEILRNNVFYPHNIHFNESLYYNPFKFYFDDGKDIKLRLNSKEANTDHNFIIKNKKFKNHLLTLWERFSTYNMPIM
ncbi:hypothetical protein HYW74_03775 [Candidatus Pacearchaeota archaeon]|nr:hypothetical protein [Candidatus Pacearchaeota archaeon]